MFKTPKFPKISVSDKNKFVSLLEKYNLILYLNLIKEFIKQEEIEKLLKSKNFYDDFLKLISQFVKRQNWFKWRNYFDKYANIKDKEKLEKMIKDDQINQAYFFMQQKFVSSIESLASYARGAIVAKILLYLPIEDMKKIGKISISLKLIIDKYHLLERRSNLAILNLHDVDIKYKVTKYFLSHNAFICVYESNFAFVYKKIGNIWKLDKRWKFEKEITHVYCYRSVSVLCADIDNNIYLYDYKTIGKFSVLKNEKILSISTFGSMSTKKIFVITNLNNYQINYDYSNLEDLKIEQMDTNALSIEFYLPGLIYFCKENVYFYNLHKKVKKEMIGLKGYVKNYWNLDGYLYVKTNVSIFFYDIDNDIFKDLNTFNFDINFLNVKKTLIDDEKNTIFILWNDGTVEFIDSKKSKKVLNKNVIDTNFNGIYIYWKDDDPKWPLIASPCISCGIQSSDMFGCGNKCSAVYCSKQCASDDWSKNHFNKCKVYLEN